MNGVTIAGTGCGLGDMVYSPVNFSAAAFQGLRSKAAGDGGLIIGGLVFTEEFEAFAGRDFDSLLQELTDDGAALTFKVGGPALVPLSLVAQLGADRGIDYQYSSIEI